MMHVRNAVSVKFVLAVLAGASLFAGCKKKKEGSEPPPDPDMTICTPTDEGTTLVGNEATWQYQYDNTGRINKIIKLNRYNQQESVMEVQSDRVVRNTGGNIVKTNYNANIYEALPSQAQVSITLSGGVEQPNYYTYHFSYDSKKRLSKIEEHTAGVPNDREWTLTITYNDNDNVTKMQYAWTTHPNEPINPITVTAYDNKYTPYAAIKYWKFLMSNFAWDNYDPEPVLTALSRNNPLDYTMNAGIPAEFKRTMTYAYNENGFAKERTNTNKNANGEVTFKQTFTFKCQ